MTPLLCGLQLPAPLSPSRASAVPVLVGGDTANVLFGKIQRAATLPGTKLSCNPIAAVDDPGRLGKVLWSQYMMSSVRCAQSYPSPLAMGSLVSRIWHTVQVPSSDAVSRDELERSPRVAKSLLFIDCTMSAAGGGLSNPFGGLFGKKPELQAGRAPDPALLSLAAARGVTHVYVMLDGGARGAVRMLVPVAEAR